MNARPGLQVNSAPSGPAMRARSSILQRKCACGNPAGAAGTCKECRRKKLPIQTKLTVNRPGDRYEREADRIANQVMNSSRTDNASPLQTLSVQRSADGEAVSAVYESPAKKTTAGQPLPAKTRQYFEPRFGHDLSRVRIHNDAAAQNSAAQLGAKAFTSGGDISFSKGQYQPQSDTGRRLLAHELTHVLQQRQAPPHLVQRAPEDDAKTEAPAAESEEKPKTILNRSDVVFSLASETAFKAAAKIASPGVAPKEVGSPSDMAAALKVVGFPIDTIYVYAHSTPTANIKFGADNWVTPGSLASTLKDSVPEPFKPNTIDFRGCSVGMDPSGMDELRQAVGARVAIGSTCWLVLKDLGLTVDDEHIKDKSQLAKPKVKATLKRNFSANADSFKSAACILDRSKDAYFRAGGYFVSVFANKDFTKVYSGTDSVCYKNLPVETLSSKGDLTKKPATADACKLIRIEEKAPVTPEEAPVSPPSVETQPEAQGEEEDG